MSLIRRTGMEVVTGLRHSGQRRSTPRCRRPRPRCCPCPSRCPRRPCPKSAVPNREKKDHPPSAPSPSPPPSPSSSGGKAGVLRMEKNRATEGTPPGPKIIPRPDWGAGGCKSWSTQRRQKMWPSPQSRTWASQSGRRQMLQLTAASRLRLCCRRRCCCCCCRAPQARRGPAEVKGLGGRGGGKAKRPLLLLLPGGRRGRRRRCCCSTAWAPSALPPTRWATLAWTCASLAAAATSRSSAPRLSSSSSPCCRCWPWRPPRIPAKMTRVTASVVARGTKRASLPLPHSPPPGALVVATKAPAAVSPSASSREPQGEEAAEAEAEAEEGGRRTVRRCSER